MNITTLKGMLLFVLLFAVLAPDAAAQSSFRLKRTKKESTPINAQIFAGYNGMSDPADIIQDYYEHSNLTSLGGIAVGLQGMVEIDTVLTQIWVGAEVAYYRLAKRWLADDPDVRYPGEELRVDAVERLWGLHGNVLFGIGPIWRVSLVFGPGVQYQFAQVDKNITIEGNLYESQVIPTALGGVNFQLLTYDHGSIDANFRGVWGFGEFGSFQFQSLLGFTFSF